MAKTRLTIHEGNSQKTAADGAKTILDALRAAGYAIEAPCGGKGLCGKCKVKAEGAGDMSAAERDMLTECEIKRGIRMACFAEISSDTHVYIAGNDGSSGAVILTGAIASAGKIPAYKELSPLLPQPSLSDQRDDQTRISDETKHRISGLSILRALPNALRESGFKPYIGLYAGETVRVCANNRPALGVAVDIGTTTVAAYLLDLRTGAQLAVDARLNSQRAYGADVLSRCDAAKTEQGLESLRRAITEQISDMAKSLCASSGHDIFDIIQVTIAGNTVMQHLFAGVSPASIAAAPFTPGFTRELTAESAQLGVSLPAAKITLLPSVAGYVGADTVAAILACGMDKSSEISLLIDIGTNGEIALGNRDGIVCCSAAAGPAFEGAHIQHGMGAIDGAISSVSIENGEARITVIGGKAAAGICGSGIIDCAAQLKKAGIMDDTGLLDADSPHVTHEYGKPAYALAPGVFLTQGDIRQIQLAKSAIAAGIAVLLGESRLIAGQIDNVYLAGGFGNYINRESACEVGLIPKELLEKIKPVGNAAGSGAKAALMWADCAERARAVASKSRYEELSSRADFQDLFVDNMFF